MAQNGRGVSLAWLVIAAFACCGCFQMNTVLKVKGNGSGTIEHRMMFSNSALAQIKQFAGLGGRGGQDFDPVSEEQARSMASSLGPGVTVLSTRPILTADGQGRETTYAFTDVNRIRINQQPDAPGGLSLRAQGLSTDVSGITLSLTHETSGNAVLHVHLPEPALSAMSSAAGGNPAIASQMAMMRSLLAGAKVAIAVEPEGNLVETTSQYVDGRRVTLLEMDLDEILSNERLLAQMQTSKTTDELRSAFKNVPGLKINLDHEITVEFTPDK
jgi:hypothetical protein